MIKLWKVVTKQIKSVERLKTAGYAFSRDCFSSLRGINSEKLLSCELGRVVEPSETTRRSRMRHIGVSVYFSYDMKTVETKLVYFSLAEVGAINAALEVSRLRDEIPDVRVIDAVRKWLIAHDDDSKWINHYSNVLIDIIKGYFFIFFCYTYLHDDLSRFLQ